MSQETGTEVLGPEETSMNVAAILKMKGKGVFTASADTSLLEIAKLLDQHGIGCIVIEGEEGKVVGIVSERDLVRAQARHGAAALELEARQVITREVETCHPDDSIEHVMELMTRGRFRHLPVLDHGELIGLISIGDVVKARLEEAHHETEALKAYIVAG